MQIKDFTYSHDYKGQEIAFELVEDAIILDSKEAYHLRSRFNKMLKTLDIIPHPDFKIFSDTKIIYKVKPSLMNKSLGMLKNSRLPKSIGRLYKNGDNFFYGKNSVIVITNEPVSKTFIKNETNGDVLEAYKKHNFYLVKYPVSTSAKNFCRKIEQLPWVVSAEKNFSTIDRNDDNNISIRRPTYIPNAGKLKEQKAYKITGTNDVHSYLANNAKLKKSLSDIKIVLLDSGVDVSHPDLKNNLNLKSGKNFINGNDDQRPSQYDPHGTLCAGLIVAKKKNKKGVDGVAKGGKLISYLVARGDLKYQMQIDIFQCCIAILDAGFEAKAHVINCSWSIDTSFKSVEAAINSVFDYGRNGDGTVVVCSAGNKGRNVRFPATLEKVITVAAVNINGEPCTGQYEWGSSNFGPEVNISAPGTNLVTTDIRYHFGKVTDAKLNYDYYQKFGATSGATPQVTGCIALIFAKWPKLKAKDIKGILEISAKPFCSKKNIKGFGKGILNVKNALNIT